MANPKQLSSYEKSSEFLSELRTILSYCPVTGELRKNGVLCENKEDSYIYVWVFGKLYLGHRICWLLHYGEWPTSILDHKNRNKQDNRISNLRESSHSRNKHNSKVAVTSTTGITGINRAGDKFRVRIMVNGVRVNVGTFNTIEEALSERRKLSVES